MFNLIISFSILIGAFIVLLKSADYLIASSSEIGRRLGISKFVIGLTIVAVGTSLPELFTSIMAIYTSINATPFILGAVVGSNIANILLVFGILLIFAKKFQVNVKIFDIVFLLISSLIIIYFILVGSISYLEGILLSGIFLVYIYYSLKAGKKKDLIHEADEIDVDGIDDKSSIVLFLIFVISLIGLNIGARGVVYGIENVGILLRVPIEFLTLSTVAFATSLPEIVVTYSTAKKGDYDIAVGNIIGSNISNVLLVIGVSSILQTIIIDSSIYILSLVFLAIATIVFVALIFHKNAKKYHGVALLILYLIYLISIF